MRFEISEDRRKEGRPLGRLEKCERCERCERCEGRTEGSGVRGQGSGSEDRREREWTMVEKGDAYVVLCIAGERWRGGQVGKE